MNSFHISSCLISPRAWVLRSKDWVQVSGTAAPGWAPRGWEGSTRLLREDPGSWSPGSPLPCPSVPCGRSQSPLSSVAGTAAEATETASLKRSGWVGLHRGNNETLKNYTAYCTAAKGSIWKGDCVSRRKALRGRESQLRRPIHAQSCWRWRCPSSGPQERLRGEQGRSTSAGRHGAHGRGREPRARPEEGLGPSPSREHLTGRFRTEEETVMALLCGREKQTTTWGHGAQGLQGDPRPGQPTSGPSKPRAVLPLGSLPPGPPRPGSSHGLFPHAPDQLPAQPGHGMNC